jgi:transaldolase/glucose-6-phosphate isomerase
VNPQLQQLAAAGQSVWLDNIRRSMFSSGELHALIELGLRGMTSNPTIFEKAIGSGTDYDTQLRDLFESESDPVKIFEALAIDDIRHACDEFRPLYDATSGGDGFVSLEVSPLLARDTLATIEAANRLWRTVDRPNVMIKIPATPEGIPAISAVVAAGINVNVTLIFSADTYEAAAVAYLEGLEVRSSAGDPIDRIGSVASVFVSRIDTAVDKLLGEHSDAGLSQLKNLFGKAGVANLKLIYQRYKRLFEGERFERLRGKGALVQRPLWASTGTKNRAYSDLLYVEELVGKNTVNTLPPGTLDILMTRGVTRPDSVERGLDAARSVFEELAAAQISMFDVTQRLQVEGVKAFADSYAAILDAIETKRRVRDGDGQRIALTRDATPPELDATLARLAQDDFLAKLWKSGPAQPFGLLDAPGQVAEDLADLTSFAAECAKRFAHVVVLGVGGNSVAPGALRATFGKVAGYPELHVLDSTNPDQIAALEEQLDLETTLFIVASKSGTTTEPDVFFRYFFDRLSKVVGADAAGKHFIAITGSGTWLARDARPFGFRRVFESDPNVSGRYSALSYSGIVPSALAGYDVAALLDRGLAELAANSRTTPVAEAEAVRLGATLGLFAKAGRDKVTIVTHPALGTFGAWVEQLLAGSTGKSGSGIVPIDGEPLGAPEDYGHDRVFVYVGAGLPDGERPAGAADASDIEKHLQALESAGHPVVRLGMHDRLDLGRQFALWQIATATAGAILGIDAFDAPDVQESKDNAARIVDAYKASGKFPEPLPAREEAWAALYPLSGSRDVALGESLESALAAVLRQAGPGDFVAFNAFLEMNPRNAQALEGLRRVVRNALAVATTAGFGPRFLHSTGQLHKGGPDAGIFIELTAEPAGDLAIPGRESFATLLHAQALGDFKSLDDRRRRGARIALKVPVEQGLAALLDAIQGALLVKA